MKLQTFLTELNLRYETVTKIISRIYYQTIRRPGVGAKTRESVQSIISMGSQRSARWENKCSSWVWKTSLIWRSCSIRRNLIDLIPGRTKVLNMSLNSQAARPPISFLLTAVWASNPTVRRKRSLMKIVSWLLESKRSRSHSNNSLSTQGVMAKWRTTITCTNYWRCKSKT